jgi:hypothetical protein
MDHVTEIISHEFLCRRVSKSNAVSHEHDQQCRFSTTLSSNGQRFQSRNTTTMLYPNGIGTFDNTLQHLSEIIVRKCSRTRRGQEIHSSTRSGCVESLQ